MYMCMHVNHLYWAQVLVTYSVEFFTSQFNVGCVGFQSLHIPLLQGDQVLQVSLGLLQEVFNQVSL